MQPRTRSSALTGTFMLSMMCAGVTAYAQQPPASAVSDRTTKVLPATSAAPTPRPTTTASRPTPAPTLTASRPTPAPTPTASTPRPTPTGKVVVHSAQ